ncbi:MULTISPECIES: DUF3813 domain-containing protein [Bacillaceae]|uniref:20S proteasome alpha/beta subunit n=1 Tax=Peribacillus huizhouensis TaxID=1501239 RepID=A0ABR6CJH4_9BACI|nr:MULTISPECIES: DUF3813 domain-containing protein [Bacillaceae]MBA9025214.1 20S proteasome alpha/beta subunit [Peribacillus huizhouensis]
MANKLFQQARKFVEEAVNSDQNQEETMEIAKNALSSAYANSTEAEQVQLRELQNKLETKIGQAPTH